jgi:hypothetical protein
MEVVSLEVEGSTAVAAEAIIKVRLRSMCSTLLCERVELPTTTIGYAALACSNGSRTSFSALAQSCS